MSIKALRIIPKSSRLKARVEEHGDVMLPLQHSKDTSDLIVQSMKNTWHGGRWVGWIKHSEAEWVEVEVDRE